MSQKSCCVPGCPLTSEDGVPLHKFPCPEKNADKFKSWISIVGGELSALDPIFVFNNKRVCDRHFEECHRYPKNRLCRLAVPALLIPAKKLAWNEKLTSPSTQQPKFKKQVRYKAKLELE